MRGEDTEEKVAYSKFMLHAASNSKIKVENLRPTKN